MKICIVCYCSVLFAIRNGTLKKYFLNLFFKLNTWSWNCKNNVLYEKTYKKIIETPYIKENKLSLFF